MSFSSSVINALLSSSSSGASNAVTVNPCNVRGITDVETRLYCWFHYSPNYAMIIVCLVLFSLLALALIIQNVRSRSLLTAWVTATAVLEVGGYAARLIVKNSNPNNSILAMTILLVISPNLLALVNYVVLGRIVAITITADEAAGVTSGTDTSSPDSTNKLAAQSTSVSGWRGSRLVRPFLRTDGRLQPTFLAYFFLVSDLASLVVQAIAASFLTSTEANKRDQGEQIMTGGLAIPLGFFAVFCVMALYVMRSRIYAIDLSAQSPAMRRVWLGLLSTLLFLELRVIYRFFEYALGLDGWISTHEVMFYVFDSLMIFLALIAYFACDFAKWLPLAEAERRTQAKSRALNTGSELAQVKVESKGADLLANGNGHGASEARAHASANGHESTVHPY